MSRVMTLELISESMRNLMRHKLRSALTLLGVVIGVGSVITMLGVGEGAQRSVIREIEGLGLGNIIIGSVQPPTSDRKDVAQSMFLRYGVTEKDVAQLCGALPFATVSVGHLVKQKVYYQSGRLDSLTLGVFPEYFSFFRTELLAGRLINEFNNCDRHRVAVVTEQVAAGMKSIGGAVGRNIRIGRHVFEVVGVVRMPLQQNSGSIFIPYMTAREIYGTYTIKVESGGQEYSQNEIGQVVVRVGNESLVPDVVRVVQETLKRNHSVPDYSLTVPLELLLSKQRTQRILNLVLVLIAAISLIIGGIGIMNIMLAIVTERIPEIGVRRALGASRQDILRQFLTETVVLSSMGGLLGCAMGYVAVPVLSAWTGWEGIVTPSAVLVSLAVSWLVGVVFGIAPAMQAARLDPAECLRYE